MSHTLRCFALALIVGALGLLSFSVAHAGPDYKDAIKEMQAVLSKSSASNDQKARAIKALAEYDGEDADKVIKALFDVLENKNLYNPRDLQQLEMDLDSAEEEYQALYTKCRQPNGSMLFHQGEQEKLAELEAKVRDLRDKIRSNSVCKNAVIDTLAMMRSDAAHDEIIDGVGDRNEDIAGSCIEAIRRQLWSGGFDAVEACYSKTKSAGIRGLCVQCLRAISVERAKTVLLKAIVDDSWFARQQAVAGLRILGDVDAVDALVQRLGNEPPGRLRWDIIEALQALTGKEFGEEAAPWRSWWAANKGSYQRPANPSAVRGPERDDGPNSTGIQFYGVPVRGNPLFIIDRSGSMIAAVDDTTPGQPTPPPAGKDSKWERLQKELFQAVENLEEGTKFAIVFYDTDVYAYKDGAILTAGPRITADIKRDIGAMAANGLTNIYGAFQRGFDLVSGNQSNSGGPVFTDGDGKLALDEIFFLTDGSPTVGESINGVAPTNPPNQEYSPLLLEEICSWNKRYNLVINTICVGRAADSGFMSALAERNRGTFVHITE